MIYACTEDLDDGQHTFGDGNVSNERREAFLCNLIHICGNFYNEHYLTCRWKIKVFLKIKPNSWQLRN